MSRLDVGFQPVFFLSNLTGMIYYVTKQTQINSEFKSSTFQEMLDYFSNEKEIQVDTETQGFFNFENEILLLQLGDEREERQYVINFQELTREELDQLDDRIFSNPDICKVFQNAKFDIKFLWLHGLDIVNVFDTMIAEIIINAGKDVDKGFYSLYSMCRRYRNVELDKSIRGDINRRGLTTAVIEYAAKDVKYLSSIKTEQLIKLREYRLADDNPQNIYTVCGLEMNAIIAFASIEYNGMKLDRNKWSLVKKEVHEKVNDIEKQIDDLVNNEPKLKKFTTIYQDLFTPAYNTTTVNWNSPSQKLKVLQTLFPQIQDTSSRTLSKYKGKHPLVNLLLEYNKANKLATAFADKLENHINPKTQRIHTNIWPILDTGRISMNNPNLQQIPSRTELGGKMRACFVPEEGNTMVGGDYAAAELRLIAEFSQDPVWINAFVEGKDLHSELCAMTFDIPVTDVRKPTPFKPDLIYRDVQKTLNFGSHV